MKYQVEMLPYRYGGPDAILPVWAEEIADRILSGLPYGGIVTIKTAPKLSGLAPTLSYQGERWMATRRQVDELDQVTFTQRKGTTE